MAFLNTSACRTSLDDFKVLFGTMVMYFRVKTAKIIDDQYYHRLKFYPYEAVEWAIKKHIDESRPTAGNFPTPNDIANLCATWLNEKPILKHSFTTYLKPDDPDYPMQFLYSAFDILTTQGKNEFYAYCNKMRMPVSDIERVICKARAVAVKYNDMNIHRLLEGIGNN